MAPGNQPSLEELARRLKECAEKLRASAQRLKMAAGQQRDHLQRLNELNERIDHTLAALRSAEPPPSADPDAAQASSFNFIDLTQYLSRKDEKSQKGEKKFPRDMTYVEALAFTNYNEFLRFRGLPQITDEDISLCDVDLLFRQLLMRP